MEVRDASGFGVYSGRRAGELSDARAVGNEGPGTRRGCNDFRLRNGPNRKMGEGGTVHPQSSVGAVFAQSHHPSRGVRTEVGVLCTGEGSAGGQGWRSGL